MEVLKEKVKFQKYPVYKDSGVEWLGEIPQNWKIVRMKYLFNDYSEKNRKESKLLSVTQDKGVVPRNWVENRMVMPSGNLESFKFIEKGDFAISLRSFEGGLEYCHHDGIISPAYTVLKQRRDDLRSAYYKYLFKSHSFISELQTSVVGIREGKNISFNELSYSLMPIPKPEEQTAIAGFLDEKCGKIDTAVAQKQKLIELSKERKQIIIQNAVTKGLDPNVKMKDSGVEWIGEIPEHWEVKKLKHILRSPLKYGANESGIEYDPDLPRYVRITDFSSDGKLNEEKKLSLSNEVGVQYLLEDGDILFARSGATVGKSYQFKKSMSSEKRYCYAGYLIKASPDFNQITSDFLNYFNLSGSFESWKNSIFNKATIENIGADKYSELKVTVPPLSEQEQITGNLESKIVKLEEVIGFQQQQIDKLKEYKSSLIDATVTGKIKVS